MIMKRCSFCLEEFPDKVTICRYCGRRLETVSLPGKKTSVKSPKKRQNGTDSIDWQTKLGKIGKDYRAPIIIIIILVAGIIFVILQKPNVNKSAQQVKAIEPRKFDAPAAPVHESTSASEPAPTPVMANNLFRNAFALCSSGKCTDPEKALEYLSEAIKLKPDYAEAYNNRGNVYGDLGQHKQAIEDYNEAIRLKPDYAMAYNNRGVDYRDLGQNQRAIEDYNEAIRLNPNDAMAYNNRGVTYRDLGQNQRAIEDYNEAIRLKPDYAMAYNNRGDKESGCRDAQKACELGSCKLLESANGKKYCR
jgi:tetratricopeptide (TPR) repeat protein